jgi:hypothetical protein
MKRFHVAVSALSLGILCLLVGCESDGPRENPCDPNPCVDANLNPLVANRSLCTATTGGAICDCDWNYVENEGGVCAYAWCTEGCNIDQHCTVVGNALAATCETNVCVPACTGTDVCVDTGEVDGDDNPVYGCSCGASGDFCQTIDRACESSVCVPRADCAPTCTAPEVCTSRPCAEEDHCAEDVTAVLECLAPACDPACDPGLRCVGEACIENICEPACADGENCTDDLLDTCRCGTGPACLATEWCVAGSCEGACGNTLDDDGDGWADADDPDCAGGDEELGLGHTGCNNGLDDDGDGLVDSQDPECTSARGDSESD